MLFSGKENVFMCLVAFQKMFWKIFSDVWWCSWKYHRKHIFYLLLAFSHIFSITKRLYNIIYSSKYKQNPEKNHQIRTNEGEIAIGEIAINEIAIAIGAVSASRHHDRDQCVHTMRRSRSREDRSGDRDCERDRWGQCRRTVMSRSILSFSPSLSLSFSSIFQGWKYFEVKIETENHFHCFGSQIRSIGNAFQFDRIWSNNQTPLFFEKSFPKSVWSRFKRSLSLEANL